MKILCTAGILLILFAVGPTSRAQTPLNPVLLAPLWQVDVNDGDFMTSENPYERDEFPGFGTNFYIPAYNVPGTGPEMWRLDAPWNNDHMDSPTPGEGGYNTDGPLGFPYSSPSIFLNMPELTRYYNGTDFDHGTGPGPSGILYSTGHWVDANFGWWGFPGYGLSTPANLTLSGGGVTIASNPMSGGQIWDWQWNGAEFLNSPDVNPTAGFGQGMQAAIFYAVPGPANPLCDSPPGSAPGSVQNPTEAGDCYSGYYAGGNVPSPEDWHGSPLVALGNANVGGAYPVQMSASIPLEFSPQNWGGSWVNPLVYTGVQLGKTITLNYQDLGPVAEYITTVMVPFTLQSAQVQVPTGIVPATLGPNNESALTYLIYDVGNISVDYPEGILMNVNSCGQTVSYALIGANQCPVITGYEPNGGSGYAGAIVSSQYGDYAMGVYGVSKAIMGSVSYFNIAYNQGASVSQWAAVYDGQINSGSGCYTTWVMTGTLANVTEYMLDLYNGQMAGSIPIQEQSCGYNYGYTTFPFDRYYSSVFGAHWVTTGNADFNDYYLEATMGYLSENPLPGTTAIYGCIENNTAANRFVSLDPGCEGHQSLGLNGYIYTSPPDGIPTQALYRCSTAVDHFVSTDPGCEGQTTNLLLGYAQTQP